MVRFPEQDPRELPQFNETSTQQRWRSAQTQALTARRAWKTTQMTVSALCSPFKTFLMRQYGEDFVTTMTKEYGNVDLSNPNAATYNTHVSVLTGPQDAVRPPDDDPDYETKIVAYEVLVAEAKQYLGMQIPDVDTATRILNLVVKMEQYRKTAEAKDSEAIIHAIESLSKGEPPSSALLRHVAQSGQLYSSDKASYPNGKKPTPIDFGGTFKGNSDDPLAWQGNNAFMRVLYIPWLGLGQNRRYKGEIIASEYEAYVKARDTATKEVRAQLWRNAFNLWAERAFGVKSDKIGFYTPTRGGGRIYLGPMMMFYAKAYGRTGDPLQYWSTHSNYRLDALDLGVNGVIVYMYRVNAVIGAPSHRGVPIAMFPPRTTTGAAIADVKQWYPNIMDVETGNNPQIDNYIKDSVSKTDIAKAGAEFMKQPQSSRDGYRYMVVTRTVLAFPGSVLYSNDLNHLDPNSKVSQNGIDSFRLGTPEERLQFMYADMLFKKGTTDLARNFSLSREQMKDDLVRLDDRSEFSDRPVMGAYDRDERMYTTDWETPFNWSKFLDYKLRYYEDGKWNPRPEADYIKKVILGIPGPHKDARVITTVDVMLVPEHFDTAIRQIEARMRELAGQYVQYDTEKHGRPVAMRVGQYWKPKVAIKEWQDLSNTLIALTSGHWAVEGSWTRSGQIRGGSYNSPYGAMGIPLPSQRTIFGANNPNSSIQGRNAAYNIAHIISHQSGHQVLQGIIATLKKYGGYDLSGVKVAYSGAVNDRDDIVSIMSQFKKAYPGVGELVMPDSSDISNLAETTRKFHANVTSVVTGKVVDIPGVAKEEWGTYMVRRVPIDTQGVSGKRYSFAQTKLYSNVLEFTTNDFSINVPGSEPSFSVGAIVGVGGLAIASMLAYKTYEKIG